MAKSLRENAGRIGDQCDYVSMLFEKWATPAGEWHWRVRASSGDVVAFDGPFKTEKELDITIARMVRGCRAGVVTVSAPPSAMLPIPELNGADSSQ